jgi:hypothetical protein
VGIRFWHKNCSEKARDRYDASVYELLENPRPDQAVALFQYQENFFVSVLAVM